MMVSMRVDGTVRVRSSLPPDSAMHEPVVREACLAWGGDPGELEADGDFDPEATREFSDVIRFDRIRQGFALLLEIGLAGATVVVDEVPEADRNLSFHLDDRRAGGWIGAEVVGVTPTPRGPHLVRLAFRDGCPFETLRAAICG